MSENRGGRLRTRREVVRRRRRERQVMVFGLLLIVIAAISFGAVAVYKGDAAGPFDSTFITPLEDWESTISLVCPPTNTKPLDPGTVAVRVMNGTETSGLAGEVEDVLKERGFVTLGAVNWTRTYPDGTIRIMFGSDGIAQAYTVARHFNDVELVFDDRTGTTIDVVVGGEYDAESSVVDVYDDALTSDADLYTDDDCLPWTQIDPETAPAVLAANPLATITASPSPSASASAEGDQD